MNAAMAVPPMPAPKMPIAVPRRFGGNQELTVGTPTANEVPPMPRKNPPMSRTVRLLSTNPTNRVGRIVSAAISGNIVRPPRRSVSAPTGIRPSDPTTTGNATTSDCWNDVSPNWSLYVAPSGPIRAHAQKVRRNPEKHRASARFAFPGSGTTGRPASRVA